MNHNYHKTWDKLINDSKHFDKMLIFIDKEKNITPLKENVFRFLSQDLSALRCIILGMDPYPSVYKDLCVTKPVATGRAFEVANVDKWTDRYRQVSLVAIFKTLYFYKYKKILSMDELRNVDENLIRYIHIKDWFDAMEKSGVMFLNASLTTIIGKSGVHTKIWKDFMDELIKYIVEYKKDIKWLIWGQDALSRVEGMVDKSNIIYTCHPASRVNNTFIKDCCFNKVKGIEWF